MDGGSLMVWACFTWRNLNPLKKIDDMMKKEDYLRILVYNIPYFVEEYAYSEE